VSTKSENQVLSKEEYPEPKSKAGFTALLKEILDLPGGVDQVILKVGKPVRVWRWVEKNGLMEEEDRSLDGALSHAEILEYANPDLPRTAPEELFHLMSIMDAERRIPVCWAVGRDQTGLLARWLRVEEQGVPYKEGSLLGLPVERLKSLPEDTLLLCGAEHPDAAPSEVTMAVKMAIEVMERNHVEEKLERNALGRRNPPEERNRPDGATPNGAPGDGGEGWKPPSFLRERFRRSSAVRGRAAGTA
jgi:hypothetical protein